MKAVRSRLSRSSRLPEMHPECTESVAARPRARGRVARILRRRKQPGEQSPNSPYLLPAPPCASHYVATLGTLRKDLLRARALLDAALAERRPRRRFAPDWAPLLLGDSYERAKQQNVLHLLHVSISYCACVQCLASEYADSDDVPDTLDLLEWSEPPPRTSQSSRASETTATYTHFEERSELGETCAMGARCAVLECGSVSALWQVPHARAERVQLPTNARLAAMGGGAARVVFELGAVRRGVAEFSSHAALLAQRWDLYFGGANAKHVLDEVARLAGTPDKSRKSARKFVLQGTVVRFVVDAGVQMVPRAHPGNKLAVAYRRQTVCIMRGVVALAGALGEFVTSDVQLTLGFGEDEEGACDVARDGALGEPRAIGINELLVHVPFQLGERTEIIMK